MIPTNIAICFDYLGTATGTLDTAAFWSPPCKYFGEQEGHNAAESSQEAGQREFATTTRSVPQEELAASVAIPSAAATTATAAVS